MYRNICTYLPRCTGRPRTRWVAHRKAVADGAMTPRPTRRRRSLNVALSVHLSLEL